MGIKCTKCGKDYDITLFQFGRAIVCAECSTLIYLDSAQRISPRKSGTKKSEGISSALRKLIIKSAS